MSLCRPGSFLRVALLLLALLFVVGCEAAVSYPETIGAETNEELRSTYRCSQIFDIELEGRAYKVLVFEEHESDQKVLFYRLEEEGYRRFGAEFNLLGFAPPELEPGPPPLLRTRLLEPEEWFYFQITEEGVEHLPEEGEWEPLGS